MSSQAAHAQHHGGHSSAPGTQITRGFGLEADARALKINTLNQSKATDGQAGRPRLQRLTLPQQHRYVLARKQRLFRAGKQLPKSESTRGPGPAPACRWRRHLCARRSKPPNLGRRQHRHLPLHGAGVVALHIRPVHDAPPGGRAGLVSGAKRLVCTLFCRRGLAVASNCTPWVMSAYDV